MAMSRSLMECGNDEVRDDGVTDICSFCATGGKLQPALHFCFDCGVYGRFLCGICLRNHNMFLNNHEVERIANQSTSKRIKGNDSKVRELQQSNEALQKDKAKLLNENAELRHTIQSIKKENDTLAKTLDETSKEADKELKSKMEDFERETKNNENRFCDLKKERDDLLSRWKKMEEFERESKNNENGFLDLKKERDDLLSRLEENDDRIKALVISNGNLQKDKNSLEEERAELMTAIRDIKRENETLSKELHDSNVKHTGHAIAKDSNRQELGLKIKKKDNSTVFMKLCVGSLKKTTKPVVLALDIGHSSLPCAYLLKVDHKVDPTSIQSFSNLEGRSKNVILFDVNKRFHKYGFKAEDKYIELVEDGVHYQWYFFRHFMLTIQEENICPTSSIKDVTGKEMKAIDVISAAIKYYKDNCISILKSRCCIDPSEIHWVIPVPATWTDSVNQLMREAAYKADINDENLTLVSEPLAMKALCQTISIYQLRCSKAIESSVPLLSSPGTKFMIIDLGEHRASFTICEYQADGNVMILKAVTGIPLGADSVISGVLDVFRNVLGGTVFQKCIDEYALDFLDMKRCIETKVWALHTGTNGTIKIRVPPQFLDKHNEMNHENMQQTTDRTQYKGKIRWTRGMAIIDAEIFKNIFKSCTDKLISYIEELLIDKIVHDTELFLMVGGFSESLMVQETIMKAFPLINVVIPNDPQLAVIKGALIYGHQH